MDAAYIAKLQYGGEAPVFKVSTNSFHVIDHCMEKLVVSSREEDGDGTLVLMEVYRLENAGKISKDEAIERLADSEVILKAKGPFTGGAFEKPYMLLRDYRRKLRDSDADTADLYAYDAEREEIVGVNNA